MCSTSRPADRISARRAGSTKLDRVTKPAVDLGPIGIWYGGIDALPTPEAIRAAQLIEELGRGGANVLHVAEGNSLVFVLQHIMGLDVQEALAVLRDALPGVKVTIVSGCEAVIKAKDVTR